MTVPGHKVVPLDLETMRACAEHMLAEDAEVLSPDVLERFTLQLLGHRPVRCSAPGRSGCGCVPSPVEGCLRESSTLNVLPGPSMPCATTTRTTTTSAAYLRRLGAGLPPPQRRSIARDPWATAESGMVVARQHFALNYVNWPTAVIESFAVAARAGGL
jgi:hypothetical protein